MSVPEQQLDLVNLKGNSLKKLQLLLKHQKQANKQKKTEEKWYGARFSGLMKQNFNCLAMITLQCFKERYYGGLEAEESHPDLNVHGGSIIFSH